MPQDFKDVFAVTENGDEKTVWSRIGVAFVNRDKSLNVVLDSLPLSGRLHIRDRVSKTKSSPEGARRKP